MKTRSPRVVRAGDDADTLTLYPSYRTMLLAVLVAVGILTVCGVLVAQTHPRGGVIAGGLAIAAAAIGLAVYIATATRPLLVISRRGIAAPLHHQGAGTIAWERVARVYPQFIWANAIAVEVWRDPGDHDAGTRTGLFVPGGMFPISSTTLLREIDRRAPE